MCIGRKSKWMPLFSTGLLIAVSPNLISHLFSIEINADYKIMIAIVGILLESTALILIKRENSQHGAC